MRIKNMGVKKHETTSVVSLNFFPVQLKFSRAKIFKRLQAQTRSKVTNLL